jgi:hypothetical protein
MTFNRHEDLVIYIRQSARDDGPNGAGAAVLTYVSVRREGELVFARRRRQSLAPRMFPNQNSFKQQEIWGDRMLLHTPTLNSSRMRHRLYPICLRNSRRCTASTSVSTPSGDPPSITPSTPRPCSVSATIASTGLAVAQKMVQTSGVC